jgi:hypothetical protein
VNNITEKKFDWYNYHCDHCGYEFKAEHYYETHPKYCPNCRHTKDWQNGRTANCQNCELYKFACHEPMKGFYPEHAKTCCYFKPLDSPVIGKPSGDGKQ